jgi:hypothetical protein
VWLIDQVPEPFDPSVNGETIRTLMDTVELFRDEPEALLRAVHTIRICLATLRTATDELDVACWTGDWTPSVWADDS